MQDILLIHRKANTKIWNDSRVWRTCLRQIFFLHPHDQLPELSEGDQLLHGQEALAFLIEILCGLHSPIFGETEVLGQFKAFVETQQLQSHSLFERQQKWLQFVFTQVKNLRTDYLSHIGPHSYGSQLRLQLKQTPSVTILGGGQLAREIIPWMAHKTQVRVISRSPSKLTDIQHKIPHLELKTYHDNSDLHQALVIAGSVDDQTVLELIARCGSNVRSIFDLRGEQNTLQQSLAGNLEYTSLQSFFAALEKNKKELAQRLQKIQKLIQVRTSEFCNRIELRPHGWDDLCA